MEKEKIFSKPFSTLIFIDAYKLKLARIERVRTKLKIVLKYKINELQDCTMQNS